MGRKGIRTVGRRKQTHEKGKRNFVVIEGGPYGTLEESTNLRRRACQGREEKIKKTHSGRKQ